MDLISIIIPVYNVEKYLEKCLDSVIHQSYENIEIILVNDGSTDTSGEICKKYSEKDKRIVLFNQENAGLSAARNTGIEICKGEYIAFVDSDDWVEKDYILKMYTECKNKNVDIVICGFNKVNENNDLILDESSKLRKRTIDNKNKFDLLFNENNLETILAWNKLYKRKIFNTLRYPVGKIHEDEFVVYDVLNNVDGDIVVLNENLYNYLIRNSSISNTISDKVLHSFEALKSRIDKTTWSKRYNIFAKCQLINNYIYVYKKAVGNKNLQLKILKEIKKYKLSLKGIPLKQKIKFTMFKIAPNLYIKFF